MSLFSSFGRSGVLRSGSLVARRLPARRVSSARSSLPDVVHAEQTPCSLGEIVRHGSGDAVITLNVGGKEFHTLRSTVNANRVLADHVARAEKNSEVTKGGAVFIDRDPTHFGFILQHLRNQVEVLSLCSGSHLEGHTKARVHLPDDDKVLRDLFVEATFYQMDDLLYTLRKKNWLTSLTSFFTGSSGNPFDSARRFLMTLRTGLLATGGLFGTAAVSAQTEFDEVLKFFGFKKDEDDEKEAKEKPAEPQIA